MNGLKHLKNPKKFIYLISPNKIVENNFYFHLENLFKTKKVQFFQLRLKKEKPKYLIRIGKKINKMCKKYKVKLIINDFPDLVKKIGADGCHIGQRDTKFLETRKILKKKLSVSHATIQ